MEAAVRTLGNRTTRQVATLILALLVGIAGFVVFLQAGSSAQKERDLKGVAAVFGLNRDAVHVAPGARVSGRLTLPAHGFESDVTWKLSGGDGLEKVDDTGKGVQFGFVAPSTGDVKLVADAIVEGEPMRTETTFVVGDVEQFAGVGIRTTGQVTVAGGPAVQGESVLPGTVIDASNGSVEFLARVTTDGGKTGRTRLEGEEFELTTEELENRVLTVVKMDRDGEATKVLAAEVEHLDGERYIGIQTPDAVAMVKGTEFTTTVSPDASEVVTTDGSVQVIDRWRYYREWRDVDAGSDTRIEALAFAKASDDWEQAVLGGTTGGAGGGSNAIAGSVGGVAGESFLDEADGLMDQLIRDEVENSPAAKQDPDGDGIAGTEPVPQDMPKDPVRGSEPVDDGFDDDFYEPIVVDSGPGDGGFSGGTNPVSSPPASGGGGGSSTPATPTCRDWERPANGKCVEKSGTYLMGSGSTSCGPNHIRWNTGAGARVCVRRDDIPPRVRVYRQRLYSGKTIGCFGSDSLHKAVWAGPGAHAYTPPKPADRWCLPYTDDEVKQRTGNGPYEPFRTTINSSGTTAYERYICLYGDHPSAPNGPNAVGLCVRDGNAPY